MELRCSHLWAIVILVGRLSQCYSFAPIVNPTLVPLTSYLPSTTPQEQSSTALMGIPKMFRWLTDQYPTIVNNRLVEGLSPNVDVDNFYLDMNGIIHPCTHGNNQDELVYLDEAAMFKKIFLYIDRLYKMVRPKRVLYLAVDGVAPRAKMNQQRSRRFRSAKEAEQMQAEILARERILGKQQRTDKTRFDSNCITPGTDFMLKLSVALSEWVDYKMRTDAFWKNGAHIIVSGPDVPGEGEHKVMDFIREESAKYQEGTKTDHYGPEWTHVMYGLDADLIMLGLVTHEKKFMLLREKMSVVMGNRGRNKNRKKKDMMQYTRHDFELLELSSLRKMLALQFSKIYKSLPDGNLNRIVDDFVFMCMLVGNDFLPHVPHFEIHKGAISNMMEAYTELLPKWKGFLTKREKIHPRRFEQLMYHMAAPEEDHFKQRGIKEQEPGWQLSADNELHKDDFYGTHFSGNPTPPAAIPGNVRGSYPEAANSTQSSLPAPSEQAKEDLANRIPGFLSFRRRHPNSKARSYRDFYYESKMGWPVEDRNRTLFARRAHVRDYLEGLHWNLNYYHNGCASWEWYFPYFYGPLATDFVNLNEFYQRDDPRDGRGFQSFAFQPGLPFPSLAQLLSVLPPQSADLLPKTLAELMLHPSSPLAAYYPTEFKEDPNGKRQSWEAVVQIPFINAEVLLDTVESILKHDEKTGDLLSDAERRRNRKGQRVVFVPQNIGFRGNRNGEKSGARGCGKGRLSHKNAAARSVSAGRSGKKATKGRLKTERM